MTPHQHKKLLKISRNFSSRVMSRDGKPKKEMKQSKSKRHYDHSQKLDEGSSVMLALQKEAVTRDSTHRHDKRNIFSAISEADEEEDDGSLSEHQEEQLLRIFKKASAESDTKSNESLSKEIGELREQVKMLTGLLMEKNSSSVPEKADL